MKTFAGSLCWTRGRNAGVGILCQTALYRVRGDGKTIMQAEKWGMIRNLCLWIGFSLERGTARRGAGT